MGTLIVNPYRYLWTPEEITTALWLDANDADSVALVDNQVSQWSDKSGNTRHLYQSTVSRRPSYIQGATNVIQADGIDDVLSSDIGVANITMANQAFTAFLVSFGTNSQFGVGGVGINGGVGVPRLYLQRGYFSYNNNNSVVLLASSGGRITTYQHDGITTVKGWLDGTFKGSATEPVLTEFGLGGYVSVPLYSATLPQFGQIGEFLVVSSIADSDRIKIEGYLAHKWGLTFNLPVTHPYKNTPPYV